MICRPWLTVPYSPVLLVPTEDTGLTGSPLGLFPIWSISKQFGYFLAAGLRE